MLDSHLPPLHPSLRKNLTLLLSLPPAPGTPAPFCAFLNEAPSFTAFFLPTRDWYSVCQNETKKGVFLISYINVDVGCRVWIEIESPKTGASVFYLFCFDRGAVSRIRIVRSYPSFAADGGATTR
ncbi:hypothetical protein POPTR_007G062021v4 [Populus trichocarpa]|uniref:Uncharacterized protein n=1 Tax=Populus trichocarpa TaxID=3694 RepID=A0ACC0SPS9_POPTR|nr:hypothetical protein POPTR_007G062021v4 [Populus trichocarpa]